MSANDSTSLLDDWNSSVAADRLPNVILKSLFLVIGITGNTIVLVMYKFRLKNERRERYFIPYMALIDILATIATCAMSITKSTRPLTFPSGHLCKALWYFLLSTTSTSAFYLLVICVIRYRKVCIRNKMELDFWVKKIILIGVATFGFILALPSLLIYGERDYTSVFRDVNVTAQVCSSMKLTGSSRIAQIIYFLAILLISIGVMVAMIVLYVKIGKVIYNSVANENLRRQNTMKMNVSLDLESTTTSTYTGSSTEKKAPKTETKSQVKRAKNNFTFMFLTVLIIYVVSFTPSVIMILALSFTNELEFWFTITGFQLNLMYFLSESYIINHVANPFVYLYFDMKFRNEMKRILRIKTS